jgi:hypothetical protein
MWAASEEDLPETTELKNLWRATPARVSRQEYLPEAAELKNLRRMAVSLETCRIFLSQGGGFATLTALKT